MHKHVEKFISLLKSKNIKSYLVTSLPDIFYLTGVPLYGYWLLFTRTNMCILTTPLLENQLKTILPTNNTFWFVGNSLQVAITKAIHKLHLNSLTIDSYPNDSLLQKLNKIKTAFLPGLVLKLRLVKDSNEIELIKQACDITHSVFLQICNLLSPGMTEREISNKIKHMFIDHGVDMAFEPIVASGENSAFPHHITSDRQIRLHEPIIIDIGCKYKGYCADLTRTIFLGKVPQECKTVYDLVYKAQQKALKEISSGKYISDIDFAARNIITKAGYRKFFLHSTGHSIGIEVHESLRLDSKTKILLKPGMVFTVEPGIYISGKFGIRIENVILVTPTGYKFLTPQKRYDRYF